MDAEVVPPEQGEMLRRPSSTQKDLPRAVVAPFSFESSNAEQFDDIATALESTHAGLTNVSTSKVLDARTSGRLPRRVSRRLSLQQKRRQLAKIREGRRTITILLPVAMPTLPAAEEGVAPAAADGCSLTPSEGHLLTSTTSSAGHPPNKKPKLACRRSARKLEFEAQAVQRTLSRETSVSKGLDGDCGESIRPNTKRSTPSTPMVLRRKTLPKTKSTEERQLETMQQLQQEVAEQCRKNAESFRGAILGSGQPVTRTIFPITKPVEFHFHTTTWLKRHPVSKSTDEFKEMDFPALLRSASCPARLPKGGCTIPKPFKFSKQNKRKLAEEEGPGKFVSMAEQVEAFFKRTPLRFRQRSRLQQNMGPSHVECKKVKSTNRNSPHFGTKLCNQVTCKSTPEPETDSQKQMLQKYKCQAQELHARPLHEGRIHSKKQSVKDLPDPIGFDLEHKKRTQEQRAKREKPGQEKGAFLARSCPTKMLMGVVGVPERPCLSNTVSKPPDFALKNKDCDHAHLVEEEKLPVLKPHTMPHHGVPFKPVSLEQRRSKLAPFSFDTRDKELLAKKVKKLEDLRKEDVPLFKARLLPAFDKVVRPQKKMKATPPPQEPFHLQVDERAAKKTQQWRQTKEGELKEQTGAAGYNTSPNAVIHAETFAPKDSPNLLGCIVQDPFQLVTERHAKGKEEFEKRIAELQDLKEMMEEERRLGKEVQRAKEKD
ncbi:targeting protein for Xklp2-B-like [Pleurodeles waltl]